jgi:Glycosyltransferase GT-D fold
MKLWYPRVLSEDQTLDEVLRGRSISRYGDGELRLMLGGTSASQKANRKLAQELVRILTDPDQRVLPCIPNARSSSPKAANWEKYTISKITNHYTLGVYGSSFVTRPDSAPWIDNLDYWGKMRSIWSRKDVTLVAGSQRSLTPQNMP